ncbi:hypothetical protein ACFV9E_36100 [Streptomyces sp. NPDC059835]|uniref:hypothetical protein n=1 Tax=Streptomyces sp. NPDC059835 TaxID=3346967 RepID=UPI003646B05F
MIYVSSDAAKCNTLDRLRHAKRPHDPACSIATRGHAHTTSADTSHTLATKLLANGAGLHHTKRFLGHISNRMAEHYAKVAVSEIEDVLQHVWVAGPSAARLGEVLSSSLAPLDRREAEALAMDLTRRSTPAEGGFCTFQPVLDGGTCPWNLNCHSCDKFVMSGTDLLYWRRKREQWTSIAERAPDDSTADYVHRVFEPTTRAIDGSEKALAGLALLEARFSGCRIIQPVTPADSRWGRVSDLV